MTAAAETILVIEDDRALAVGLDLSLSDAGYTVVVAREGRVGLRRALDEDPDLVVLDLMLPDVDGLEVLRQLRDRDREMPVIILSARAEEQDKVAGLTGGADDYVVKPFALTELLARIDASLRRQRRARRAGARTHFGSIEVDHIARTVTRAGKPVSLTAREFDLLAHFIAHPGEVHGRDRLLAAVWGYDYRGTARTVDNFVRNLRVKLEEDPADPVFLRTVHGAGYRFDT